MCKDADKGKGEKETTITKLNSGEIHLRVQVTSGGKCNFYYSADGKTFTKTGEEFIAEVGKWIGAKVGIFCTRETQINDSGWADFDWFRVEKVE
jgi:hypothetical protein